MSAAGTGWQALTDAQREAWATYAVTIWAPDTIARWRPYSGQAAYAQAIMWAGRYGVTPDPTDPPPLDSLATPIRSVVAYRHTTPHYPFPIYEWWLDVTFFAPTAAPMILGVDATWRNPITKLWSLFAIPSTFPITQGTVNAQLTLPTSWPGFGFVDDAQAWRIWPATEALHLAHPFMAWGGWTEAT